MASASSSTGLRAQVQALFQQQRFSDALAFCRAHTQTIPQDAEAWRLLGSVYSRLQQSEQALAAYRQALTLEARSADTLHEMGMVYAMQGVVAEAEEFFRRALALKPNDAASHYQLGNLYLSQAERAKAIAAYRQALVGLAHSVELHSNLGVALHDHGDLGQAHRHLLRARELAPQLAQVHYNLGRTEQALGHVRSAKTCYERALQLDPRFIQARYSLGTVLRSERQLRESRICFEHVLALNSDHHDARFNLASVLEELGQHEESVAAYRVLLSKRPNDIEALYNMAGTLHTLGKTAEAIQALHQALNLNPHFEAAGYLLAALQKDIVPASAPASYVRRLFDDYAAHFDRHLLNELHYQTPALLAGVLTPLLGEVRRDQIIIDLGCGTGLSGIAFRAWSSKLIGVDLSPRMIEQARAKALYDELHVEELTEALAHYAGAIDLALACDVFVYIGDLAPTFAACRAALKPGGWFAFSTEQGTPDGPYQLHATGRYTHSEPYLRQLAIEAKFDVRIFESTTLRQQSGHPVTGYLVVLQAVNGA